MSIEDFKKWENETLLKGYFPIKAFIPIVWGKRYVGYLLFQNNEALPISHDRYNRVKNYLTVVGIPTSEI